MRGEAGVWLKIAERTGRTPQEAMDSHTLSDFLDWQAYFEEELTGTSKLDRQLARITYYLHLVFLAVLKQKPDNKTEDDFLVRYERTTKVADPVKKGLPPVQPNGKWYDPKKVAASKAAWLTATGFRKPGDKKPAVVKRMPPKKKGK